MRLLERILTSLYVSILAAAPLKAEGIQNLGNNEYVMPREAFRALELVADPRASGSFDESSFGVPLGVTINSGYLPDSFFDFLPFVSSRRERFEDLLREHTSFSESQIDSSADIFNTPSAIVYSEGNFSPEVQYHEHIHRELKSLTNKDFLQTARDNFVSWAGKERVFPYTNSSGENDTLNYFIEYIRPMESFSIQTGNWEELYTNLATNDCFRTNNRFDLRTSTYQPTISEGFYQAFKDKEPEAYAIYESIRDKVAEELNIDSKSLPHR
jgi:hypothetical protein